MLRRRSPLLNGFYCGGFEHDRARPVDWVTGACLLVRGVPLRGAGGFDESFFLYSEEVDLLRRLADEGGETWFDPAAGAVHLWGAVTANAPGPAFREQLRSHVRYLHKHSGPAAARAVRLILLAGLVLRAPRDRRLPRGPPLARSARRRRAPGRRVTRPVATVSAVTILAVVLWASLALLVWTHVGYPLLAAVVARLLPAAGARRRRRCRRSRS